MDTGERLAAYLAGDLDADEARALETDLQRDAALRERLEHIRAADDALEALPDASPRPGFPAELRAAVDDELARRLGDELAARRRWSRRIPAWVAPAAAAAAVVAIVGGVVVVGGGGDDVGTEMAQREALDDAGDGAATAQLDAPTILASGDDYGEDAVTDLTDDPRFEDVVGRRLTADGAAALARRYSEQLGVPTSGPDISADAESAEEPDSDGDTADQPGVEEEAPAPERAPAGDVPVTAMQAGPVTDADLQAVQRCLPELLSITEGSVIPVFAEIATYEGEDAILYGLVSPDPDTGAATRTEVWAIARDDCIPLFFTQGSGESR